MKGQRARGIVSVACHGYTGPSYVRTPWIYLMRSIVFGVGALICVATITSVLVQVAFGVESQSFTSGTPALLIVWALFAWLMTLTMNPNRVPARPRTLR